MTLGLGMINWGIWGQVKLTIVVLATVLGKSYTPMINLDEGDLSISFLVLSIMV